MALLHYGDRDDPAWNHQLVQVQGDVSGTGGNWGTGLWGRLLELGGGSHWWHRYSCELIRYKVNTADGRDLSMSEGIELGWWLERQINAATPFELGLTSYNGQELIEVMVTQMRAREAGGPENYIWKIVLQIQGLAHHAY